MNTRDPQSYNDHHPHSCRRASFHNYKAPCTYMITITKDPSAPDFSTLAGIPGDARNPPVAILSDTGKIIDQQIIDLNSKAEFAIDAHILMPDHIHIIWRVKKWLIKDLGYHVGLFKSRCTKIWREKYCIMNATSQPPLFKEKFNDRIGFNEDIVRRLINYTLDNPRRRLMIKLWPNLFTMAQQVRILGLVFDVFGNFQLLKHPMISAAVVSSRYTPSQREAFEREWDETIRSKGVLISPFISAAEKELMHRHLNAGGSIIRIIADGIGPKYKPSGAEFELCAQGRCLHIGMPRQSMHKEKLDRSQCLLLNQLAFWIASHPAETMSLIKGAMMRRH